ncbi:hypothetical protein [Sporolactobacillus inulinus]|uniref:Uncharacterized protein n=1 Tax=Sporolactobacillus inulinus CASD TaxID=1069536 RepID=A0A0U1QSD6_9BACL|nr:hypothetical protein [Sporolactobacillus inulinus]KLI03717.1 hypothetical protein SINU_01380 [Sporolactobacillus inulinus CASD]GEB77378.1 hypothetical protein SIN01_17230 [Sporolactobacillus inulinus]
MQLAMIPISGNHTERLTVNVQNKIVKTMKHMELEIERLAGSKLALDQAKQIIITQQLEGMKTVIQLAGYTLIYQ